MFTSKMNHKKEFTAKAGSCAEQHHDIESGQQWHIVHHSRKLACGGATG